MPVKNKRDSKPSIALRRSPRFDTKLEPRCSNRNRKVLGELTNKETRQKEENGPISNTKNGNKVKENKKLLNEKKLGYVPL